MDEDWLENDTEAQGGPTDPLVAQQFERISTRYADAGYREGITEGKLSALQAGFDEAFARSVHPARRLGRLRGRTSSVLAMLKAIGPIGQSSAVLEAEESLRVLMVEMNRLRRTDVLLPDTEAEEHGRQEHGEVPITIGEDSAMTEETRDRRAVEKLEAALEGMGGNGDANGMRQGDKLREDALLDELESRLGVLETAVWAG